MNGKKRGAIAALLLAFTLLWAMPALAHKVNVFAYAEDGKVYCESYFPDGRPVEGGTIEVRNSAGTVLVSGKTDKEGKFVFTQPVAQDLTIIINASMGHKNSFLLKKEEME